ncbi:hypothetical protein N9L33_02315 [Nitrospinae bacterium]|nr:hypothetical protein [Nitrospinota bacterium]
MMKIFQFCKIEYIAALFLLIFPLPVLGNQFYNSLPDQKLEEIKIIDNHTVEIEIGPDNLVSCNILEALQSIPYVGAGREPDTVFVNKEKVYHFRKGLYTWDREGKYRVRLTTKYIRAFGNIQIHVPEEETVIQEKQKTSSKNITSAYHQSLPQNIKEEITIIDEAMVEVGIGPDRHSVSTTILHAIKSIPSVKEGVEPKNVLINEEPIHHVRKGVYTWDIEGRSVVQLTAKYIHKFGNIQVHLTGEESSFVSRKEPEPAIYKDPTALIDFFPTAYLLGKNETRPAIKEILMEKKNIFAEPIVTHPDIKEESFVQPAPSTQWLPHKIMTGVVKGFRLAQFGMSEDQVIKTIQSDFSQSENNIEKRKNPKTDQRVLTISSLTLNPQNEKALIHYYFSFQDQTLTRVDVIWGHPDYSKVNHSVLHQSAEKFKKLFSRLVTQSANPAEDNNPYIFYGEDMLGNGVKLKWETPYNNHFQPLSKPEPTLLLSYFQPLK